MSRLKAAGLIFGYQPHHLAVSLESRHIGVRAPSIDAGEITDKGYINQRAVLERRAELVAALFGDGEPVVICAPIG